MLLFSLPYLIDFICGLIMFNFIANIIRFEEELKNPNVNHNEEGYFIKLPVNFNKNDE
jgi:hypothetical protein